MDNKKEKAKILPEIFEVKYFFDMQQLDIKEK